MHTQNDLLQWFIDITKPEERNVMKHIYDILVMNFAAIHTSSNVSENYFVVVVVAVILEGLSFGNCT